MSYARFSEGDVYVYHNGEHYTCNLCCLHGLDTHCETTAAGVLAHLREHIAMGNAVPERAIHRLMDDVSDDVDSR